MAALRAKVARQTERRPSLSSRLRALPLSRLRLRQAQSVGAWLNSCQLLFERSNKGTAVFEFSIDFLKCVVLSEQSVRRVFDVSRRCYGYRSTMLTSLREAESSL